MCSAYQRVQEQKNPDIQTVNIFTSGHLMGQSIPAHNSEPQYNQFTNPGYVSAMQPIPLPTVSSGANLPLNDVPPKYDA